MTRTIPELRALLGRLESETADDVESEDLEFKPWEESFKDFNRMLREAVVCLANARGGEIVVGVRDRVRGRRNAIVGVGPCDTAAIRRQIYDGTAPSILVEIDELVEPEGRLLVVRVPRGMPPHTTSDGVGKLRVGKHCIPLTGSLLAQLMASGGQRDRTADLVAPLVWEDLDPAEIAQLRSIVEREAQGKGLARLPDRALLEALGLVGTDGITVAALLLVGKRVALARHLPQHEVTFMRFRSPTRYDQREDLRDGLLSCLRTLERLVSVHNRVRTAQEEGFGQLEFPDLSWEVAREAVLNAVAHRDYFARQGVLVALHRDRLDVTSPGGFVGGVNPENVLRHPPVHRNELLARVLQTVGLVNRVGLGVDRIYEGLLRLGKDLPRWSSDESHVRLSIPLVTDEPFALFVHAEERRGRRLELDELMVLRGLAHAPSLDRWSAARLLQLTEQEASLVLARLREAGLLVVRGRGQSASYELRRDLATRLRRDEVPAGDVALDEEAVRLRLLKLLEDRGELSNAEIRRLSGFTRQQVYRLVKELEAEGRVKFVGRGRGARITSAKS